MKRKEKLTKDIDGIPSFMHPYLESQGINDNNIDYIVNPPEMNDKWKLNDIRKAIDLILDSKMIAIIGDYDFDGVAATSIAVIGLSYIGKKLRWYVPNRFRDGYGLNVSLVDKAYEAGADTIFTVDNGIAAGEAIQYAKDLGMTVVVSDHHAISSLPNADAIVHPALGVYPFSGISGSQVVFKILMAIFETCHVDPAGLKEYFFQLSAVSIVSDVMPLASENMEFNENRLWLQKGLESLNRNPKKPFKHLISQNGFSKIDEESLGYYIVPCINAVGRLYDASYCVRYFTTTNDEKLSEMCQKIIGINSERKDLVKQQMEENNPIYSPDGKAVFIIGDDIHEGIAGLIAGKYSSGKGTISFCFTRAKKDGEAFYKGSGRNDTDISVMDLLSHIPNDIMIGYGGHHDACGLSIKLDRMDDFIRYASEYADANATSNALYVTDIDRSQLPEVKEFISSFKPFGNGFTLPVIRTRMELCNIMTTASGAIRLEFQKYPDNIDMWVRERSDDLDALIKKQNGKKEYASGAVQYSLEGIYATATSEMSYSPQKASHLRWNSQSAYVVSYNCLNVKLG